MEGDLLRRFLIPFVLLYTAAVVYSLLTQFYFYEAVVAFLTVSPIFLAIFCRAPRRTLLAALVLSLCINPGVALVEDDSFAFSIAVSLYLSDIILCFAWLHIVLSRIRKTPSLVNSRMRIGKTAYLFAAWIAAGVFSTVFAANQGIAVMEIVAMVRVFLIFLAMYYLVESKQDLRFVAGLFVGACAIQALLVLAQSAYGGQLIRLPGGSRELDMVSGGTVFRPGGTLGHPSNFAKLASFSMPIAFSLFQESVGNVRRGWFGLVAVLIMLSLMVSLSRIGLITSILAVLWVMSRSLRSAKGRRVFLSSLLVCAVAIGAAWAVGGDRLTERMSNDEHSSEARIPMWLTAVQVIAHHPLGTGLNNYLNVAVRYDDFGIVRTFPFPVHNIYLLYLAEIGIVGGSVFIWLVVSTIRLAFRSAGEAANDLDAALLRSLGIGLACSWLQGMVGWGHRSCVIHLAYFAVSAGVVAAHRNLVRRDALCARVARAGTRTAAASLASPLLPMAAEKSFHQERA